MSVIADFSIPAEQFAIGHVLEVRPGVKIRLETMIPTSGVVIPYFWVETPDVEAVAAALRDSDIVDEVSIVDEIGDEALFHVRWNDQVDGLIEAIDESEAFILQGRGEGDRWSFQLRFPEYEALSAFYRAVVEKDISIDLEGIHDLISATEETGFGLTPEQREVLSLALAEGYFAVPREITLV
ncbi:MAG: bacterio-opsin activator domain-containing protein, partial [Haloarculaceae archaeon]